MAERPLGAAARQVLQERFAAVQACLPPADAGPVLEGAALLALRDAAGRLTTALRLFTDLLPHAATAPLRPALLRLAQGADRVGRLDTLLEQLTDGDGELADAAPATVLRRLRDWRTAAAQPLAEDLRAWQTAAPAQRAATLVDLVAFRPPRRGQPEPSFASRASHLFRPLVRSFLQAWQADLDDPAALQRVWLGGRRVRYAAELLLPAFDAGFQHGPYRRLCRVQDRLDHLYEQEAAVRAWRQLQAVLDRRDEQRFLDPWVQHAVVTWQESRRRFFRGWTPRRTGRLRLDLMCYALAEGQDHARRPASGGAPRDLAAPHTMSALC